MVSVVITTYNNEKYILKCIESVFEQTYKNIEVIIVNDGSTDNSENIIKNYLKDKFHYVYLCQNNSGVSVARNRGIEVAKGEYIMFVDGDDYIKHNMIEELLGCMDEQTDIVSCCCEGFNDFEKHINLFFNEDQIIQTIAEKEKLYLQLMKTESQQPINQKIFTGIGVPWGKLYRREMLCHNNILFKPSLTRMQDNIFNMHAFKYAKKIIYINKPLYNYRINHISNCMNEYTPDVYKNILLERRKFFENNLDYMTSDISKGYITECADYYCLSIKYICKNNDYSKATNKIIELNKSEIYKRIINKKASGNKKIMMLLFLQKIHFTLFIYLFCRFK